MFAYANITFTSPILTIGIVIWGLYVGLVIACAMAIRSKNISSEIVSSLKDSGADCEENAVTLSDAGIKKTRRCLKALKYGTVLRRYVVCENEKEMRCKVDKKKFSSKLARFFSISKDFYEKLTPEAKFYIPEEKRITAEVKFTSKKKTSYFTVVIYALLLAAVMVFISFAIPRLTEMLDAMITYLSSL